MVARLSLCYGFEIFLALTSETSMCDVYVCILHHFCVLNCNFVNDICSLTHIHRHARYISEYMAVDHPTSLLQYFYLTNSSIYLFGNVSYMVWVGLKVLSRAACQVCLGVLVYQRGGLSTVACYQRLWCIHKYCAFEVCVTVCNLDNTNTVQPRLPVCVCVHITIYSFER